MTNTLVINTSIIASAYLKFIKYINLYILSGCISIYDEQGNDGSLLFTLPVSPSYDVDFPMTCNFEMSSLTGRIYTSTGECKLINSYNTNHSVITWAYLNLSFVIL